MSPEVPVQPPEGKVIAAAARSDGRTVLDLAAAANMSDTRWRQIIKGYARVAGNIVAVRAPSGTLARMARVVGVTPQQLDEAGRTDAAEALRSMGPASSIESLDAEVVHKGSFTKVIKAILSNPGLDDTHKLEMINLVTELYERVLKFDGSGTELRQSATNHET